ncbi:MAG: efflux RND transporter periplasmic adaptor subunit [Pseudomonadota bacterium]|nr:efflux RND transporter periplasmic adaptor subunit [Pseudomonadota bacterium]
MNSKMKWGGIVAALAVVVVVSAFSLLGQRNRQSDPPVVIDPAQGSAARQRDAVRFPADAPQLTLISSTAISASPIPTTEPLSARIVYDDDVTARVAVSFSGRIVALKAAAGDSVRAGQVLAEIDSPDFGSASADLLKARADEQLKRLVFERAKELGPGEAIAAREMDSARADFEQAQAERIRAEQRVANLNPQGLSIQGQRVSLTSPVNGVVTERTATPSLEVSPALPAPLFVIADLRHLWLMIDLPERLLSRMKVGSAVGVECDAYPDKRFTARIVQLGEVVDPNTRRIVVRARLDNPEARLLPEMFVRASVLQDSGSGVKVPNGAIVIRGNRTFVFVQTAPGEFRRQAVKLVTQGGDFSYVGDGLAGGEKVVTSGALLLDAEISTRADGNS